jgi:hypothetical protein
VIALAHREDARGWTGHAWLMSTTRPRLAGAVLLSVAAHVLIGAILIWSARAPAYQEAADETLLVLRLVPPPARVAPPASGSASSSATRVLARPWTPGEATEPAPGSASAAGEDVGPLAGAEAPVGETAPEKIRRALRSGPVGCANADLVGLNRQERTHCDDLFGSNMVQIRRAMREAEQRRLSTGGEPPTDFDRFRAAEGRLKAASGDRGCAARCAEEDQVGDARAD